jgi:hypothetical protein
MIKLLFLDYTSLPLAGEIIAVSEFVEWRTTFSGFASGVDSKIQKFSHSQKSKKVKLLNQAQMPRLRKTSVVRSCFSSMFN